MNLIFRNRRKKYCMLPQTPGIKLMGFFKNETRRDIRKVIFDESCQYNGCSKDGVNILFGYTFGRDRVYIGWRYLVITKRVELYIITEIDGKYKERNLYCIINFNTAYIISLVVDWKNKKVTASAEAALSKSSLLPTVETLSSDGISIKFFNFCISTGMLPRLGNIQSNPEGKMKIRIEKV